MSLEYWADGPGYAKASPGFPVLGRRSFSEGGKPGDDSQDLNFKQRQTHFRDLAAGFLREV
jgi:hypothetical protein